MCPSLLKASVKLASFNRMHFINHPLFFLLWGCTWSLNKMILLMYALTIAHLKYDSPILLISVHFWLLVTFLGLSFITNEQWLYYTYSVTKYSFITFTISIPLCIWLEVGQIGFQGHGGRQSGRSSLRRKHWTKLLHEGYVDFSKMDLW